MKKINKRRIANKVMVSGISALNSVLKKINKDFDLACDVILKCKGKVINIGI